MPVLLDTNAYVAFKRGQQEATEILRRAPAIGINTIVLGELLSGFAVGSRNEVNRRELAAFLAVPRAVVLPIDSGTAAAYAGIYANLRRAGTPIPQTTCGLRPVPFSMGSVFFPTTSISGWSQGFGWARPYEN